MSSYTRAGGDEFRLELGDCLVDLFLDLRAHARRAEEETIESSADRNIGVYHAANGPTPFKLEEGLASPAEEKEEENEVAEARCSHSINKIVLTRRG